MIGINETINIGESFQDFEADFLGEKTSSCNMFVKLR